MVPTFLEYWPETTMNTNSFAEQAKIAINSVGGFRKTKSRKLRLRRHSIEDDESMDVLEVLSSIDCQSGRQDQSEL